MNYLADGGRSRFWSPIQSMDFRACTHPLNLDLIRRAVGLDRGSNERDF
jgi:hypothetical protein